MRFKKVTLENYKSFQFPTEINFPETTRERPLFLIGGMNGAGKS
jgi:DNA sulfur modification protein DndD